MHFYYKITNLINEKVYIGETADVDGRWRIHKSKIAHNDGLLINKVIFQEGIENFEFEVIACSKTSEFKIELETELIIQYDAYNPEKGYNKKHLGSPGKFKFSKNEVKSIKLDRDNGMSQITLSIKYNCSIGTIRKACKIDEDSLEVSWWNEDLF